MRRYKDAIHGNALAGANEKHIADADSIHRDLGLLIVSHDARCFWGEVHQFLDGSARFALGASFEIFSDFDERDDDGAVSK